jgi:hypothetical protein
VAGGRQKKPHDLTDYGEHRGQNNLVRLYLGNFCAANVLQYCLTVAS